MMWVGLITRYKRSKPPYNKNWPGSACVFAWFPVRTTDGVWVWLAWVIRNRTILWTPSIAPPFPSIYFGYETTYTLPKDTE